MRGALRRITRLDFRESVLWHESPAGSLSEGGDGVKTTRIAVVLLLCLAGFPAHSDLKAPSCERIEGWAGQYDAGDRWQVTPYVRIAGITRDEHMEPLFGQSLLKWSSEDFATFNERIATCRNEAQQQQRFAAIPVLNNARRAVFNAAGYVERIDKSIDKAGNAVRELIGLPDSAKKKEAIHQAERSLKGRFDRRKLSGLPQHAQASISAIDDARRYLPVDYVDKYAARLSEEYRAQSKPAPQESDTTTASGNKTRNAKGAGLELDPPTIAAGPDLRRTRFEGVHLGMHPEQAIAHLEEKGYEVERRSTSLLRLSPVKKYPVDAVTLSIDEVTPFPGGKMTKEESRAYQTSLAIDALKTKKFNIEIFEGQLARLTVSGSSLEEVDTLRAETVRKLGKPHKERGREGGGYWSLIYYEDPSEITEADLQLDIGYRRAQYTDLLEGENKPYATVNYSILVCKVYPECL